MTRECNELNKKYSGYRELGERITMNRDAVEMYRGLAEDMSNADNLISKHTLEIERLEKKRAKLLVEMMDEFLTLENPKEYAVLKDWYIDGLTWGEIGNEIGYSERYVRKLHTNALLSISERGQKMTQKNTK